MARNAIDILAEKQLRNTAVRRGLLSLFLQHGYALSHSDIDERTAAAYDRVTIYRTLRTFVEAGLIHEIIDAEHKVKYSLCAGNCDDHAHHDDHLHFKCQSCEHTYCLPEVKAPAVAVPKTYQTHSVQVLVTGVCEQCGVVGSKG